MAIKRDRARVNRTAEVFTPECLVDEMIMTLFEQDPTLLTDADKTFLDPACGDGNFLVRVLHWKLRYDKELAEGKEGKEKEKLVQRIMRSIYGVDLMRDNVRECRNRLVDVAADYLNISHKEASSKFSETLCGRNDTYDGDGKLIRRGRFGNIACHDALTWDFENWRPKNSTAHIAAETGGMIVFEQPVVLEKTEEESVQDILGENAPDAVVPPRPVEILGGEFFVSN